MITKRPAEERGKTEIGWLHGRHSFSFGQYYDPAHMGFRSLRVLNDDIVEPGEGFGTHPHRDAEIFTYVIEGSLEHKDSMGNGRIIQPREFQYMSAGGGVTHSEFNPSDRERVHLLQVWLKPSAPGGTPTYAQTALNGDTPQNGLTLLASGRQKAPIRFRQNADVLFGSVQAGKSAEVNLGADRHAWLQMIRGEISVLGESLGEGDGAAISGEAKFAIKAGEDAEFLLFNLS